VNRDVAALRAELKRQGLIVRLARNGHYKVTLPDGRFVVTMPSTPSDGRALANSRADIRRRLREMRYQLATPSGDLSVRSIPPTEGKQ
jgi:hypothetical protein